MTLSNKATLTQTWRTYQHNTTQHNMNNTNNSQTQNRRRNVIWYNPPYSKNVRTNVGGAFLQLINKHFPPSNKLHKLLNRHTVRISYSGVGSMKCFINKRILTRDAKQNNTTNDICTCNCWWPDECPEAGICLRNSVVYLVDVTTKNNRRKEKLHEHYG